MLAIAVIAAAVDVGGDRSDRGGGVMLAIAVGVGDRGWYWRRRGVGGGG